MQEAGVAEDEARYGAAVRLALLDIQLLDLQQSMASSLQSHQAVLDDDMQHTHSQLSTLAVI